jgi:hypothetical protein
MEPEFEAKLQRRRRSSTRLRDSENLIASGARKISEVDGFVI